jgi:hypothetical protein
MPLYGKRLIPRHRQRPPSDEHRVLDCLRREWLEEFTDAAPVVHKTHRVGDRLLALIEFLDDGEDGHSFMVGRFVGTPAHPGVTFAERGVSYYEGRDLAEERFRDRIVALHAGHAWDG